MSVEKIAQILREEEETVKEWLAEDQKVKLKVPNEEASNIIDGIGGRGMGYLFENMDEMDIQAERRNTAREKQLADAAEKRADALEEEVQRLRKLLEIQEQK